MSNWSCLLESLKNRLPSFCLPSSSQLTWMDRSPVEKKIKLSNLIENIGVESNIQSSFQKQKDVAECKLVSYTPDELRLLTDGFKREMFIEEFLFGDMYHGTVSDKEQEVTVVVLGKFLADTNEIMEFIEALKILIHSSIMNHPGFARPIGFCSGPPIWGLVFDLASLSTLSDKLCDVGFTWSQRMVVALRLAQSLKCLHEFDPSFTIYTLDKRLIIIDKDFNPRLIPYGKRLGKKGFFNCGRPMPLYLIRYGYIAPEMCCTARPSTKADVYSYGILLLELISMSHALDHSRGHSKSHITDWVPTRGENDKLEGSFVHEKLQQLEFFRHEDGNAVTELAVQCVAKEMKNRPSMLDVIASLERLQIMKDLMITS